MPRPAAIAVWVGLQTGVLLAAAAGVRVWSHQPNPPESLALPELVAVQIAAAALLFPVLLDDGRTLAVNLATVLPLVQLAGLLSAAPQAIVLRSTAFVVLWLLGLATWARLARTDRGRGVAVAAASLLSLGGVLLWYARAEAAAQSGVENPDPLQFGPLMAGVVGSANPDVRSGIAGWIGDLAPLLLGLPLLLRFRRRPARRPASHSSPLDPETGR